MHDTNPTILNMYNTDVITYTMYIYITIIDMSYCETFAWDHPSEKYAREIESFPQGLGQNNIWNHQGHLDNNLIINMKHTQH